MNVEESKFLLIVGKLDNSLTAEENKQLDTWLKTDIANQKQYDQVLELWSNVQKSSHLKTASQETDWQVIQKHIQLNSKQTQTPWYWAAASIVLIGCAASYFLWFSPVMQWHTYRAEAGKRVVELNDGSTVTLVEGSELNVHTDYGDDNRTIRLTGQAHFDVQKNADLPFEITTGLTETTVLGTNFTLTQLADEVQLNVIEGKVSFSSGSDQLIVTGGEAALFANGLSKIEYDENDHSWLTEVLIFENADLTYVVKILQNHYKINLSIDPKVDPSAYKLTHRIENLTVTDALDEIALLLDLEVVKTAQGYLFIHTKR